MESYFELAKNSITSKKQERLEKTLEAYNDFLERYPESKLLKQVENTQQRTLKLIATFKKS